MPTEDHTYRDALASGPAHRRGAGINPGNRFERVRLHVLGEELDLQRAEREAAGGGPVRVERQVFEDRTVRIINRVAPTSDVPFDWTVNPYRGCEHGCVYCFARPFHEFLGFSSGLDFETKIMAKPDAPELLRKELAHPGWKPEPIVMSAITDIYQPLEHSMKLGRRCLEVMAECGQPVSTMTKSAMVLRDVDLWSRLAKIGAGRVTVTLVTLDPELAAGLEPRATTPAGRLRIVRELTAAGIPVTVNVAPVIPGLTDSEAPEILKAAAEAGAVRANWILLRLPHQLKDVFLEWLSRSVHPDRARKVESLIRQTREGALYQADSSRHRGRGVIAEQLEQTFRVFGRRYGLDKPMPALSGASFRRPEVGGQMGLFAAGE